MDNIDAFIDRYIGMWHEPDAIRRSAIVASLWAEDGENYTGKSISRGHQQIAERVTRAHVQWVAEKDYVFRAAGNTDSHHNLIKFFWHMLPKGGGAIEAVGLDVFVMNEDGRIRVLYQFNEPNPA